MFLSGVKRGVEEWTQPGEIRGEKRGEGRKVERGGYWRELKQCFAKQSVCVCVCVCVCIISPDLVQKTARLPKRE